MKHAFVGLLVVHGFVHLLGFTKAFGLYAAPQLAQSISRPWGIAWAAACVVMVASAGLLGTSWRGWWGVGVAAVVLSQTTIVSA